MTIDDQFYTAIKNHENLFIWKNRLVKTPFEFWPLTQLASLGSKPTRKIAIVEILNDGFND